MHLSAAGPPVSEVPCLRDRHWCRAGIGLVRTWRGSINMKHIHALVALLLVISLMISQTVHAAGDPTTAPSQVDNSRQTYFDLLLGGDFYERHGDLILAKVLNGPKDPASGSRMTYALDVVADYRANLKEHEHITVNGNSAHNGSNIAPMPELPLNHVVLLYVSATERPGTFEFAGQLTAPFGKVTPKVIDPVQVDDVKHAIAEMHRLIPGDGHGPVPHDEAKRLLESKIYSLWALGACLLAFEGRVDEVQAIARAAGTADATLAQLDWVRYLLTEVVPDQAQAKAKEELPLTILNYISTHNPELQYLQP